MRRHYDEHYDDYPPNRVYRNNNHSEYDCNEACEAIAQQCMEVDTPVRIEVLTKSRDVRIECGEPVICDYYSEPDCHRKSGCEFVVKQFIGVRIPISYHVNADVADSYVHCQRNHDC